MAAAIDRHGEPSVRAAMLRLLGRNFAHGSDLAKAIDRAIGKGPERPALRAVGTKPDCPDCGGSGWTSAPGTNDATRCSCNPHPTSREASA